jgi:hypothetical protein
LNGWTWNRWVQFHCIGFPAGASAASIDEAVNQAAARKGAVDFMP